jgi:serine/threonine-protein kinase
MGEVYRARDPRLNRTVAIKVLAAHVSADAEFRCRFEREARAIAALNHPHICTVYDVGRHEGIDFLVMEHLEGETLATRLANGALPLHDALTIATDIAWALDAAHRQGIVHRDLKPANVMLTKGGAKLLDFGLSTLRPIEAAGHGALSAPETVAARLTSPGAIVGTLHYMAPEQLEGLDADARTDIYAFGVVLYEMLTRTLPFNGKTPASLIAAILTATPAAITHLQPLVPLSLNHVVATCLVRDPDERWQSVRDIAHSLNGITETPATMTDVPSVRRGRREQLAWIAAGVGLLAALSAWAITFFGSAPEQAVAAVRATIPLGPGQRLAVTETPAFAISPDGSTVAYLVGKPEGTTELYVRRLDSSTATAVPESSGATYPTFSPDGHWIAFIAAEGLRRVPLSGGAPLTVLPAGTFEAVRGLMWGADNAFIVSTFETGLMRVPDTGGALTVLTNPDYNAREKSHRWPFALPDGRGVLMTVSTADAASFNEARVEILQPGSGQRTKLFDGGSFARYLPTGHVVFARAGALFAVPFNLSTLTVNGPTRSVLAPLLTEPAYGHAHVDMSETGTVVYVSSGERRNNRPFLWVDGDGKRVPAVVSRRPFVNGRISPDGTRIAAMVEGATAEIWAFDFDDDKSTRLAFGWDNGNPVWRPDGERIFFGSTRSATRVNNIFSQASDGTGTAEQLTTNPDHQAPFAVSADGRQLLFIQRNGNDQRGWDIRSLSLADRSVSLLPGSPRLAVQRPGLSPDGRWIAYHSNQGIRDEVYVQAYPEGGRLWQVSSGGGIAPVWARNGEELFYRRGDTVMAASVARGAAFRAGTPRLVFKTDLVGPIDAGRDGRLLMIEPEKEDVITELSLIVNWFDELKRLMSAAR